MITRFKRLRAWFVAVGLSAGALVFPSNLFASWTEMHLSGQSCIGKTASLLTYEQLSVANKSTTVDAQVFCPIATTTGLLDNNTTVPPGKTILKFGVVYSAPSGTFTCTGNLQEYLDPGTGGAATLGNHWQTQTFNGTSTAITYANFSFNVGSNKMIAAGDAEAVALDCTLPRLDATVGTPTRVYGYSVAYQQ